MKHRFHRITLLAAFAALCLAQVPQPAPQPPPGLQVKVPNGKPQRDESRKVGEDDNRKDGGEQVELAQQLRGDLEKNSRYVFSLADHKKAEDIERLAHRIRTRMQHN